MTGTIYLGATEYSLGEADDYALVSIKRSGDSSGAVTIKYATNPGTATGGSDYTDTDGTIIMPAGVDSIAIKVPIHNDALAEATETFNFSIVSVTSGTLLFPRTANISILDDEKPFVEPTQPPLKSNYVVTTTNVVNNLHSPITVKWIPGHGTEAFLVEKGGVIKVVDTATGATKSVLLDINKEVNDATDRGLLDIALHPDLAHHPYLYAYYVADPADAAGKTGLDGLDGTGNRYAYVVRYELNLSGSTPTIVPGSKTIMLGGAGDSLSDISGNGKLDFTDPVNSTYHASDIDPVTGLYKQDYIKVDSLSHAGGALAFGPDGALYVSVGDGTSYNFADPRSKSVQDLDSLSGKILRIDPITGNGLSDNPFAESGNLDSNQSKVWQLGLRNPYAITFAADGRLFISDTGWYTHEEINTGGKGANFGWPYYEGGDAGNNVKTTVYEDLSGAESFYAQVTAGKSLITAPFRAFSHLDSDPGYQVQAIVGSSHIYDGDKYPATFSDDYFFTDVVDGEIYSVDINDRTKLKFLTDVGTPSTYGPVSFLQGPDGYMYYVDLYGGKITRINIADPSIVAKGANDEYLFANTTANQTINGISSKDVFVLGASATKYEWAATEDGKGIVVWDSKGYDILYGFETLRFTNISIDVSQNANGPVYLDYPSVTQHLKGTTTADTFVISGSSSAYRWGPTDDGKGVVVWTAAKSDDHYDVLKGFERIQFNDITIVISKVAGAVAFSVAPDGQAGSDMLTSAGKDTLVFNTALVAGHVETIKGFARFDDTIALDDAVFGKLHHHGTLQSKYFHVGAKAADKNDFIIYNKKTGELFYDSDGKKHGHAPIEFATLDNHAHLTHADFLVI